MRTSTCGMRDITARVSKIREQMFRLTIATQSSLRHIVLNTNETTDNVETED